MGSTASRDGAFWYVTFATSWGAVRSGSRLFVSPEPRGFGLGKALLATLATPCADRGSGRLKWWLLKVEYPLDRLLRLDRQATHGRVEGLALALGLNPDAPRGLNKVTLTDA